MQMIEGGKWSDLAKPLAVMSKVRQDGDGEVQTRYECVGVVRRKVVFNTMPSPITRQLAPAKPKKQRVGEQAPTPMEAERTQVVQPQEQPVAQPVAAV